MEFGVMGVKRETALRGGICQSSTAAEMLNERGTVSRTVRKLPVIGSKDSGEWGTRAKRDRSRDAKLLQGGRMKSSANEK